MSKSDFLKKYGYKLGKVIGEGSFSKVYMAEYINPKLLYEPNKQLVACKVIETEKAPSLFLEKFLPRELSILAKLNHAFIIRIHSILKWNKKFYIFMTYCQNGDLLRFVKSNGPLKENRAKVWLVQIIEALDYLHNKLEIAHRDLKCENILLSGSWNVKVADFGFATPFQDSDKKSQTFCGSVSYAPPEVVSGTPYDPRKADVWSLGVIFFVMLNKKMPFDDSDLKKLHNQQMKREWTIRKEIVDFLSPETKSFLYNLLDPIPETRQPIAVLIKNKWIFNHPKESLTSVHSSVGK